LCEYHNSILRNDGSSLIESSFFIDGWLSTLDLRKERKILDNRDKLCYCCVGMQKCNGKETNYANLKATNKSPINSTTMSLIY